LLFPPFSPLTPLNPRIQRTKIGGKEQVKSKDFDLSPFYSQEGFAFFVLILYDLFGIGMFNGRFLFWGERADVVFFLKF